MNNRFGVRNGWFIKAAIEARLGRIASAQEFYRKGLPYAERHFQDPTIPYDGERLFIGLYVELSRRLAAEALGDAVPTDAPPTK
jgi:hypothetical protein